MPFEWGEADVTLHKLKRERKKNAGGAKDNKYACINIFNMIENEHFDGPCVELLPVQFRAQQSVVTPSLFFFRPSLFLPLEFAFLSFFLFLLGIYK